MRFFTRKKGVPESIRDAFKMRFNCKRYILMGMATQR